MAPAAAAPADTAPPMLDTKDYGLEIQVALWTLLLVSGAFLSLRLFCKISKHITWWDDILLAVSWVRLTALLLLLLLLLSRAASQLTVSSLPPPL